MSSNELELTTAGELRPTDIGSRVVTIDESGNAYDGLLSWITAYASSHPKLPSERVRISLKIASGEKSELSLGQLPLDYQIQIAREVVA